ncbi:MAG TPA: HAMP domain-containing protein [Miltoncostaeaceae bacterium]|nr:HAMP domain-containing protein [Miltoncostaeaceae bacterium]
MAAVDVNTGRAGGRRRPTPPAAAADAADPALVALLAGLEAAAGGDFTARVALPDEGIGRDLALAFNRLVESNAGMERELARVRRTVGRDGLISERAAPPVASGAWQRSVDSLNSLIDDLVRPTTEFARVIEAVAKGDLSERMPARIEGHPVRGEFSRIRATVNQMVERLSSFAGEVTRVAREVGTEGKLGGQARVKGVSGTWRDLTDSVNSMASNLTDQVRNIAEVTTAVADGDLSRKITVDVRGEVLQLKDTINTMVDQLRSFADEVTRVAREVGTEGKLGGQAQMSGVSGVWKDLTDNVNTLAGNLTSQVRNIAQVTTAVARGDLSQKITVDARGEVLELKDTINTMVDQLRSFAAEVTRVAREVGTEGKLGGQARVEDVSGTWRDLTDSVNFMASNLTDQVRNIAEVTTAVAKGDLSQKITVDVKGEVLQLKDTINTMVDQLSSFADEVTRVAREVGTEGKLGGQANVRGVSGTWRDLTDSVNFMASSLTTQVRNIAQVTTAVAKGDLSQKITVDVKGEVLELKDTVNTMVDQLRSFAAEVTRVAREVGTEGELGGQANVEGVSGTWRDLTDSVNFMASSLTTQVRNIAHVSTAVAQGDLSQKITVDARGEILELATTINTMVDQLSSFADEVTRVAREVGTEGKLGGQANVRGVSGTWRDLTDSVNSMASNLTDQVRNIAEVTTAVAQGDLSRKITVDVRGEVLQLKDTINTMVDQLRSFADEVTRVAREVGTEGKLGGQANVEGVSGTWRGLTHSVNSMASNLTDQVRNIAEVTTAVADGDLSQKITVDARGEVLQLKDTINTMVDQLSSFAAEVTRVAREVGTEGKLGGQANVEGVAGTWRGLTDSVNSMAANLTDQVRAIAAVSVAVTQGDLTRSIGVEAQGEVAELKDTINQMIVNLRETTGRNADQSWLNSNLARFGGMMQGQRDLAVVSDLIMSELTPLVGARLGAFFLVEGSPGDEPAITLAASYGYRPQDEVRALRLGEGLVGQAALDLSPVVIEAPPADYIQISSGLGRAAPGSILIQPVLFEDQVLGVIELASFATFDEVHRTFLEQLAETIGIVINAIVANMRTEELLEQSQSLTQELQSRQEELQGTNAELAEKMALLADQNERIEVKNREIEMARLAIEEKAEQLALSSRYKSEFLANMSHELRTPLNSLLILARLLADNGDGNLSDKQVDFARTIFASGNELLDLIDDILDLSKVEAGKMDVNPGRVALDEVVAYVERSFRLLVEEKGLDFEVALEPGTAAALVTDEQRLQQILRNLLSNAVKFTETGAVRLRIGEAPAGAGSSSPALAEAGRVIAFSVTDTGIGIPADRLGLIFEAFQQADGTTSRRFGGTGLGLSISREIAHLLGGEIVIESTVEVGSTFTLYLPLAIPDRIDPGGPGGRAPAPADTPAPARIADDRDALDGAERVLLVIEDDPSLAQGLVRAGRAAGFACVAATRGDTGLRLAHQVHPDAVVLDLGLPALDGWTVLSHLRRHPATRNVPVHVVTGIGQAEAALEAGATSVSTAPVPPERLIEALRGTAPSEARLAGPAGSGEEVLSGRRALIVDDDVRNVFALASALESRGMEVVFAENGADGIALLTRERGIDIVLLDLMMPGMDGYEATRAIRRMPEVGGLPIIVVTAKAMPGDRERAISCGASDYITKPVDTDQLLALMGIWLYPSTEPPGAFALEG